jgi:hypothetical protein
VLILAANRQVSIRRTDFRYGDPHPLGEVSSYSSTFIAATLHVIPWESEPYLVVGDTMRSIALLRIQTETGSVVPGDRSQAIDGVLALGGMHDGEDGVIVSDVS